MPCLACTFCLPFPQVALRWLCSRSLLRQEGITKELIDRIPGKQTDRKTPLGELRGLTVGQLFWAAKCREQAVDATVRFIAATGMALAPLLTVPALPLMLICPNRIITAGELNWGFTAITDTIAWNVLPRALFQKLFRQVRCFHATRYKLVVLLPAWNLRPEAAWDRQRVDRQRQLVADAAQQAGHPTLLLGLTPALHSPLAERAMPDPLWLLCLLASRFFSQETC